MNFNLGLIPLLPFLGATVLMLFGRKWTRDTVFVVAALAIGAALVVGGEWKHGTVPTVLTWQPRRIRLLGARLAACSALAVVIAFALLVVFVVVGVLPSVVVHGEIGDVGGTWTASLAGAVARNLCLVALAAALGGAIASAGRSTTVAVVGVFAYEAVIEPIARAHWPERSGWLVSENAVALATGKPLESEEFTRSVLAGGLTLAVYVGLAVAASLVLFGRRDVAA